MTSEQDEKKALIRATIEELARLQQAHGLSQKEIAQAIGIRTVDLSRAKSVPNINDMSIAKRKKNLARLATFKGTVAVLDTTASLLLEEQAKPNAKATSSKAFADSKTTTTPSLLDYLYQHTFVAVLIAGFFNFLCSLAFQSIAGYNNIERGVFFSLYGVMFALNMALALLFFATLYAYFKGQIYLQSQARAHLRKPFMWALYAVLFISVFVLRGILTRDSYLLCTFLKKPCNGPLGEPNFELVATSFSAMIILYAVLSYLRKKETGIEIRPLPEYTFLYALASAAAFCAIDLLLRLSDWLAITPKDDCLWGDCSIFKFSFSHPERVLWVFIVACSLIYAALRSFRGYFEGRGG